MVTRTKWVDRKFDFNFTVGVFPSIIERLRGTPVRLADLTASLSEEVLTEKIDGKWSIKENAGHLYDLDELHAGRLDDFLEGKEVLRPADMKNQKTEDADHNSRSLEEILETFRDERMQFVKRLEGLSEEEAGLVSKHPRLDTPMRLIDMIYFTAEHDDHHLASISEIIRRTKV